MPIQLSKLFLMLWVMAGLWVLCPQQSSAQDVPPPVATDSLEKAADSLANLAVQELPKPIIIRKPPAEELSRPAKAALLSAMLPGAGQLYNRRWWKVPLVYGGFGFFGFVINQFHEEYILARNNLAYISDADPTNDQLIPLRFTGIGADGFRLRRDRFRRDRDYNIILCGLWYLLNVADATVDAHLKTFDVSDDLAGKIRPSVQRMDLNGQPIPGISLTFTLRPAADPSFSTRNKKVSGF